MDSGNNFHINVQLVNRYFWKPTHSTTHTANFTHQTNQLQSNSGNNNFTLRHTTNWNYDRTTNTLHHCADKTETLQTAPHQQPPQPIPLNPEPVNLQPRPIAPTAAPHIPTTHLKPATKPPTRLRSRSPIRERRPAWFPERSDTLELFEQEKAAKNKPPLTRPKKPTNTVHKSTSSKAPAPTPPQPTRQEPPPSDSSGSYTYTDDSPDSFEQEPHVRVIPKQQPQPSPAPNTKPAAKR